MTTLHRGFPSLLLGLLASPLAVMSSASFTLESDSIYVVAGLAVPRTFVLRQAAAPPAGVPDASFGLHRLTAFPNPARPGERMTIRLEAGLADAALLSIHDASGRLVRSAALEAPAILDGGGGAGPRYAYDFAWDTGGMRSGVYIYSVKARRAGQPEIRGSGKGALAR